MTRIKPNLTLPPAPELRDFKLVKFDEMLANRNHANKHPESLLLSVYQRVPVQPPFPAHAAAITKDVRIAGLKKARADLLANAAAFPKMWLEYARELDDLKRIASRRLAVDDDVLRHEEHVDDLNERSRVHFFHTVYLLVKKREAAQEKIRWLQHAVYQHLRAETLAQGKAEALDLKKMIAAGFKKHAALLAWRLDDLFTVLGNHSVVKTEAGGYKIEHEIGRLCDELRKIATAKHQEWRLDSLFTTLPNGGLVQLHHSGSGERRETAEAELHAPVTRKRSEGFRTWREGITTVATPNHGMIEVRHQGHMPEATAAMLELPKLQAKRNLDTDWHRSHLLLTRPNGGWVAASSQIFGRIPERVTGDVTWLHRRHVSCRHWDWRLSNLMTLTGNGGFAPQKAHHGNTVEKVSAEAERPHKLHVIGMFRQWHRDFLFGPTPNGGFAPRKNVGRVVEAVAAAATDAPRRTAKARVDLWHAMHRYKQTPNHGWAPLKGGGQLLEHVGAEVAGAVQDELVGERLARHLADLYTPTSNGAMRRVGRDGKIIEHVAAQIAPPNEGLGALENVASQGGHALAEAALAVVHSHEARQDGRIRALQRNLAGQAPSESLLKAHVQPAKPEPGEAAPVDDATVKPKTEPKTGAA